MVTLLTAAIVIRIHRGASLVGPFGDDQISARLSFLSAKEFFAADAGSGNEFSQVVSIRAIAAKGLGVEQSLNCHNQCRLDKNVDRRTG